MYCYNIVGEYINNYPRLFPAGLKATARGVAFKFFFTLYLNSPIACLLGLVNDNEEVQYTPSNIYVLFV